MVKVVVKIGATRRAKLQSNVKPTQHPSFYKPDALPVALPTVLKNRKLMKINE